MKGKRIDIIDLTQRFNKFRMEHQSKTYTREELLKEFNKLGMNSAIATMFMAKFIPSERVGKGKLYSMSAEPIHKSQIQGVYDLYNSGRRSLNLEKSNKTAQLSEEEAAMKLLQEKGYQVRRVVGFNLEKFKAENPVLYKKYLKYEVV